MVKQHGSDVESRKAKPNMAGSGQDDFQYARGAGG
jgi:hypothetical protein